MSCLFCGVCRLLFCEHIFIDTTNIIFQVDIVYFSTDNRTGQYPVGLPKINMSLSEHGLHCVMTAS